MDKIPVILVVEDNVSISKLVEFKLKKDGYTVFTANNGITGLEQIREIKPDLVVLDVMMPGMTGFEVLHEVKSDPELKGIKVILLTSKSREEDLQRGFDLGVNEYMAKPFKIDEFSMRVKRTLAGS